MIHTIQVDHVLRETVATPYRDLVTRPTGAAVRLWIQHQVSRLACHTTLLDFSAVGLLDFSCADEIVAKLLLGTAPDAERFFLLRGLTEDQREAIDHVLDHHALAIAELDDPGAPPSVLGRLNADARAAFRAVAEGGPGDAAGLASRLDWPVERAADALQTLALLRLVAAEGGSYQPLAVA
jgi:hypothetical protein